jgi:uncharacterized protein YqeY
LQEEGDRQALSLDEGEAQSGGESRQASVQDSIEQLRKQGETMLVRKEQAELAILKAFLPESASDEEIKAEVDKAALAMGSPTAKDMGAVMTGSAFRPQRKRKTR